MLREYTTVDSQLVAVCMIALLRSLCYGSNLTDLMRHGRAFPQSAMSHKQYSFCF